MIRKIFIFLIVIILISDVTAQYLNGSLSLNKNAYAYAEFSHISAALHDLKASDLSLCVSLVRRPDLDSRQLADMIYTWDPQEHKRDIAAVFRNKITRLVERLRRIDYEQLIIDMDLIKNSHLTTGQIIKILKGLQVNNRG